MYSRSIHIGWLIPIWIAILVVLASVAVFFRILMGAAGLTS